MRSQEQQAAFERGKAEALSRKRTLDEFTRFMVATEPCDAQRAAEVMEDQRKAMNLVERWAERDRARTAPEVNN